MMIKCWYILLRWLRLLKKVTPVNIVYALILLCFFISMPLLALMKCHRLGRQIFFHLFRYYYLLFPNRQYEDGINEGLMMLGLKQIPSEYQQQYDAKNILHGWINNFIELIGAYTPIYSYARVRDFIKKYRDQLQDILDDKDNIIITMTHSSSSIFFVLVYLFYHTRIKQKPRKIYMLFNNRKSWRYRFSYWGFRYYRLDVTMFAISDNSIVTFKQLIRDMRQSNGQRTAVFTMHDITYSNMYSFFDAFDKRKYNIEYRITKFLGRDAFYNDAASKLLQQCKANAYSMLIAHKNQHELLLNISRKFDYTEADDLFNQTVKDTETLMIHAPYAIRWHQAGRFYDVPTLTNDNGIKKAIMAIQ